MLYGRDYFQERAKDPRRLEMMRQEIARLELAPSGMVLDYGCGTGDFLRLFPDGWEKYGVEPSKYARQQCDGVSFDPHPPCDLIVFRGVLQHLLWIDGLRKLRQTRTWLKPGGRLAILATPNEASLVYRLHGTLPCFAPPRERWVPRADYLALTLRRTIGFTDIRIHYPYLGTPYAQPVRDHLRFLFKPTPFWRNMMEVHARKPLE